MVVEVGEGDGDGDLDGLWSVGWRRCAGGVCPCMRRTVKMETFHCWEGDEGDGNCRMVASKWH